MTVSYVFGKTTKKNSLKISTCNKLNSRHGTYLDTYFVLPFCFVTRNTIFPVSNLMFEISANGNRSKYDFSEETTQEHVTDPGNNMKT